MNHSDNSINSNSIAYVRYQEQTSLLSDGLLVLEDRLQYMSVSDCEWVHTNNQQGLAIERSDNRWVLVYVEKISYTEEIEPTIPGISRFDTIFLTKRKMKTRTERKYLLSCSVKDKAWAVEHMGEFLEFARNHHQERMKSVGAANMALSSLLKSKPLSDCALYARQDELSRGAKEGD